MLPHLLPLYIPPSTHALCDTSIVFYFLHQQVKDQLKEYAHFIAINSYLLSTPGRQDYGLIQLALAQPFATGVHKAAKEIVESNLKNDQFFVGWW